MSTPVIFLHGAGADHTVWRFQTRWLTHRGWRVLAPDLPGHGANPEPALASIEEMAAWLATLIEPTPPAVLVGHSMGALVAIEAGAERSDLVAGIVLSGVSPAMEVHPDLMAAAEAGDPLASELIAAWSVPRAHTGGHPEPGTWQVGATARLTQRSRPGVLASGLAACAAYDGAARGSQLEVNTLIVAGTDDRMTPSRSARELAAIIPGATLAVLAGAGHAPMIQMPRRFNAVLEEFLVSLGKRSGR